MSAQSIHAFAITVPDYDDAIAYYCGVLGFELVEDTPLTPDKRWVLIRPKRGAGIQHPFGACRIHRTKRKHWQSNRRTGVRVSEYR